ncbi:MAG: hypothetical protein Q7U40_04840, partial [Desulfatirhabdiaceae bacterium]|nr:hypothetical protein [Desulfatirhabdiaceae bacterium]
FDGVRREIARIALERLIADGRIHPARIEEVVNKVKSDMENMLREVGEKAALEAGVPGLPQEILKLHLKSFRMLFPILPPWMWKH